MTIRRQFHDAFSSREQLQLAHPAHVESENRSVVRAIFTHLSVEVAAALC
jgi:hypothetical protein